MASWRGWVRDHPWVIVSFLVGTFVGLMVTLPLVPYSLPDGTANLVGAALGAGIAVWGAAWITGSHSRKARSTALEVMQRIATPYLKSIEELHHAMDSSPRSPDAIQRAAARFTVELNGLKMRTASLGSAMLQVGAVALLAHADITEILQHASDDQADLERLVTDETMDDGDRILGLEKTVGFIGASGKAVINVIESLRNDLHTL